MKTHAEAVKSYPDCLLGVYSTSKRAVKLLRFLGHEEVELNVVDLNRFDRQMRLFGKRDQLKISSSTWVWSASVVVRSWHFR